MTAVTPKLPLRKTGNLLLLFVAAVDDGDADDEVASHERWTPSTVHEHSVRTFKSGKSNLTNTHPLTRPHCLPPNDCDDDVMTTRMLLLVLLLPGKNPQQRLP